MKENERNSSLKIIIADPKACLLSVVVVIDLFTQSTDVVFLDSFTNLQHYFPINHSVAFINF